MSYVDYEYYSKTYGGKIITADDAPNLLHNASETIDTLTYCRIVSCGLDALTEFQRGIIQRVVCALAEWQQENADILDNPYNSYSINGVAASWGSAQGVKSIGGIMIPSRLYAELVKTGLCYRGV
jgi:hypothetical protein